MKRAEILINNINDVHAAIHKACQKSGRTCENVRLIAVTKYAKDDDVLTLLNQNCLLHIGESRIQQAENRWTRPEFARFNVIKHFIGHLQKNKAAKAAALFDFIDSLDNLQTAAALNEKAGLINKNLRVLVQLKVTDRETQSGIHLNNAEAFLKALKPLKQLSVCGYMAIAPRTDNPEQLRPLFRQIKTLFDRDFPSTLPERYLSVGMSEDFEVAVEEGATLPRIGSSIFSRNLEDS